MMVEDKEKKLKCSSCENEVGRGHTEFKCPKCGKETIVRCKSCRILGINYTCSKCGFTGP